MRQQLRVDRIPERFSRNRANASGSAYAILIGDDEMAGGYMTVQDLRADKDLELEAKQVKVQRDALVEYLLKA